MTTTWSAPGVSVTTAARTFSLRVGDFITFASNPLGVRIDEFVGKDPAGPMGMVYRPWLGDKYADCNFGLRGNPCFIICYPAGLDHYGQHIDWETVEVCDAPLVL